MTVEDPTVAQTMHVYAASLTGLDDERERDKTAESEESLSRTFCGDR